MRVKNRSVSVVGYTIPDQHIRRRFVPGEIKDVPADELNQLMYQPGGHYLLANYLQIHKDDLKQLDSMAKPEREYFLSEEGVKDLLNKGSLNEFLDALDFAPQGVIDLIKNYAVSLPLNDISKIDALRKKTGFDAAKALANLKATQENNSDATSTESAPAAAPVRQRRVQEEPKYTIVD